MPARLLAALSCLFTMPGLAEPAALEEPPAGAEAEVPIADLGEIVVTPSRAPRSALEIPQATSVIDGDALDRRMPQATPDALRSEVGIAVQKTGQGGGSPIVRGRTGKSVLLLLDGQRFNNATFRRNHQYLNTIDIGAVDRIEIVRGPASVLYGSDAMGGAINVITRRRGITGEDGGAGRLLSQFRSANLGFLGHAGGEAEIRGFGATAGFTYKDLGDLRAGDHGNPAGAVDRHGLQHPSGYAEHDLSFSLNRRLSDADEVDLFVLYGRQEDVPRCDRLIPNAKRPSPPDLEREYDPQVTRWLALRYRRDDAASALESARVTASLNMPEEGRRRIAASDPATRIRERDELTIPGLSAHLGFRIHPRHLVTFGSEAYVEMIDSKREMVDIATGAKTRDPNGRYPDGARYESYGIFVQDEWEIASGLHWLNGVRYSACRVAFDLDGLQVGPAGPFGRSSETYDDVTFSTGLSTRVTERTSVYGSIARGFRAPNLDDLATLGDFASGDRIPNVDLEPESVWAFELGAKHRGRRMRGGSAAAVALYEDLLDNAFAFSQGGVDYFRIDNVSRAILYSLEGWLEVDVIEAAERMPAHTVFASAFWNYGHDRTDGEPMSSIPPAQGIAGYRLASPAGGWFAEVSARGALSQSRLSAADREDPRIPIGGTPAWWTLDIRGGIDLAEGLRLSPAVENILDRRYRVHGSGIDAPGVDAVIRLDWRF
ncbi:MAG: TonB-dependent receptor [Planctomycetes bacterium]|nr:TonB-dependent receptor [Planctomycetota bacterium]